MRPFARSGPLALALLGLVTAFAAVPTAAVPAPIPGEYYFTSFLDEGLTGSIQHVVPGQQAAVSSGGQFVNPIDMLNVAGIGLIVVDPDAAGGGGALFHVDPLTGAQKVISSGQFFRDPVGVERAADGSYLIADASATGEPAPGPAAAKRIGAAVAGRGGAVIRVHPSTGVQTLVSTGGFFFEPRGLAIEPSGQILVTDSSESDGRVIRVDPTTGAQTLLSSAGAMEGPAGIVASGAGEIYVADPRFEGIFRVDPVTGAQTDITPGVSPFAIPWGITLDAEGELYISDDGMVGTGVVRLNPVTKAFSVVGSGHLLADPGGLAVAEDGTVLVADTEAFGGSGGIVRLTPPVRTQVATGGFLQSPGGLVSTPLGLFVAVSNGLNGGGGVVKVDPLTGTQTQITTGGELHTAVGITYSPDGNLYVTDVRIVQGQGQSGIVRVNPTTGAQSVVVRGQGLYSPFGIVAEANGQLLVTDDREDASNSEGEDGTQYLSTQGGIAALRGRLAARSRRVRIAEAEEPTGFVLRVDPNTGAITPLAALNAPSAISLDRDGNALVTAGLFVGEGGASVFRVNAVTGTVASITPEPTLHLPFGVAEAPDGSVLATDFSFFEFPGAVQRFGATAGAPSIDVSYDSLIWPFGITLPAVTNDAPPTLTAPGPLRVEQDSAYGATVNYQVQVSDDKPGVTLQCVPPPGSTFPLGTTLVTCTATDSAGQTATAQFPVTVTAPTSFFWARVFVNGDIIGERTRRRVVGIVQNRSRTALVGSLTFSLDGGRTVVICRQLTAMVVDGNQARIFGKATINRRGSYDFCAYLDDLGPGGSRLDRARIQVSNGIDSSGPFYGDVRILRR